MLAMCWSKVLMIQIDLRMSNYACKRGLLIKAMRLFKYLDYKLKWGYYIMHTKTNYLGYIDGEISLRLDTWLAYWSKQLIIELSLK